MFWFGIPLSMENFFIFSPLGLSIAPPLAFLGIFYLSFFRNTLFITSLSYNLLIFLCYGLLISTFLMIISFATAQSTPDLLNYFVKQVLALSLGIISFFVVRGFFTVYGYKPLVWIVFGSIPAIALSLFQSFGVS